MFALVRHPKNSLNVVVMVCGWYWGPKKYTQDYAHKNHKKPQHKTNSTILDDSYSKTQLYSLLCSYLVTRKTLAHKTWNEIKRDSTRYGPVVLRTPARSVTRHPVHIVRCRLALSRHCEHPRWIRNLQGLVSAT